MGIIPINATLVSVIVCEPDVSSVTLKLATPHSKVV
jgi:hypothetical protein